MTKEEALALVRSNIVNKNLYKHMLACGVVMKSLSKRFGGDEEKWELAGILHDLDYDRTADDFANHGLVSWKMLTDLGVEPQIADTVRAHPAHAEFPPKNEMEWSLHIVDPITGLIVAATLMHPTKKIANLDVQYVFRRFKEKRFAAGADRDQISLCDSKLHIPIEEFIEISLDAMKGIEKELGL
jgi:uncharacterized protein